MTGGIAGAPNPALLGQLRKDYPTATPQQAQDMGKLWTLVYQLARRSEMLSPVEIAGISQICSQLTSANSELWDFSEKIRRVAIETSNAEPGFTEKKASWNVLVELLS